MSVSVTRRFSVTADEYGELERRVRRLEALIVPGALTGGPGAGNGTGPVEPFEIRSGDRAARGAAADHLNEFYRETYTADPTLGDQLYFSMNNQSGVATWTRVIGYGFPD